MTTISNELAASAFRSSPGSSQIKFAPIEPGKTPKPRRSETLTVLSILKGSDIGGWRLKSVLLVQIRRTRKQSLATSWLEGVTEYGVGKTDSEAITDLVMSVGEYRESLEKQENKLGDTAQKELSYLRRLVERSSGDSAQ